MAVNYNNSYNKVIYSSHPVKLNDFLNNTYNATHKELFEYANKRAYYSFFKALTNAMNDDTMLSENEKKRFNKLKDIYYRIDTYENFLNNVSIIEKGGSEYWNSSSVLWRTKSYPFIVLSISDDFISDNSNFWFSSNTGQMNLSYWWNKETEQFDNESLDEELKGYEITFINYVSGKVTLYNRQTDHTIETTTDKIRANMPLNDEYTLDTTFRELYYK